MIHQRKILKAIAYAILLCFTSLTGAQPLYAIPANTQLPTGPDGTVGMPHDVLENVTTGRNGNTLTITQDGKTSVLEWGNFSIGADAAVEFKSTVDGFNSLNYVTGANAPISEIYGQLTALGGNIFIANPAGVQIGNSAQINVGSLYVTNKDVGDAVKHLGKNSKTDEIVSAIREHGVAETNAELMSLGAIVNAKNVTFDGGRIVLDTERIYAEQDGEMQKVADLSKILDIRTTDTNNVVLGYDAYQEGTDYSNAETKNFSVTNKEGKSETVDGYMWVHNLAELQAMDTNRSGNYALRNSIDANATATNEFIPIGGTQVFSGNFDGLGYSIFGLNVNSDESAGLFSTIQGANIRNFTLNGGKISGGKYVGAVAGSAMNSTIENITNTASVSGKGGDRENGVGGIIGYAGNAKMSGLINIGTISGLENSENVGGIVGYMSNGTLTGETYNLGSVTGGWNIGGIAGQMTNGAKIGNDGSNAFQIYNQLNIDGEYNVGGIAGTLSDSTITNAANHGNITATGKTDDTYRYHTAVKGENNIPGYGDDDIFGGLEKPNENDAVHNNLATVKVDAANVGGIVGKADGSDTDKAVIENVLNDGDVMSKTEGGDSYYIAGNVGGIVGRAENTNITNAENKENTVAGAHNVGGVAGFLGGDSTVDTGVNNGGDITATGARRGDSYVQERVRPYSPEENEAFNVGNIGGIVGYLFGDDAKVKNSGNRGTVHSANIDNVDNVPETAKAANVGGVVGKIDTPEATTLDEIKNYAQNGYADGQPTVLNSYSTGNVRGYTGVGGVVGMMYNGSVAGSYNLGTVQSSRAVSGGREPLNMGGVVGDTTEDTKANAVIYDVYNAGTIGDDDYEYYGRHVGGVVGRLSGTVEKAYNTGDIYNGYGTVGGIVGWWTAGDIKNVFNTGNITVVNNDDENGVSQVGGIAGAHSGADSTLSYAYNLGTIRSFTPYGFKTTGDKGRLSNAVGGIIGYARNYTNTAGLKIKNVYTTNNIYAAIDNKNDTQIIFDSTDEGLGAIYGRGDYTLNNINNAYYVEMYGSGFEDLSRTAGVKGTVIKDANGDFEGFDDFTFNNQKGNDVDNSVDGWRIYDGTTPILNAFLPNSEEYFSGLNNDALSGLGIAENGIQYGTAANPLLTIINAKGDGSETVTLDWKTLGSSGNASFAVYNGGLTLNNFGTETGYYRGTIYADGALNVKGTADHNFNLGSSANLYGTNVTLNANGDATIYGNVTSTNGDISISGGDIEILGKLASSKAGETTQPVKNIAKEMTVAGNAFSNLKDPKAAVDTVSDAYAHTPNVGNVKDGNITVNASGAAEVLYGNLGTGSVSTAGNFTVNGGTTDGGKTFSGGSVYVDSDLSGTTGNINLSAGGEVLLDITNIAKANESDDDKNGARVLHTFLDNHSNGKSKITLDSENDDEIIAIDMWNDGTDTGSFALDKYNLANGKTLKDAFDNLDLGNGLSAEDIVHIWISDANQLKGIQSYAETNRDSGILGYNFALKGNIDASELEGYKAIGGDEAYSGTFDGRGFRIIGLNADAKDENSASSGIFSTLSGTVKDLRVYASKFFGGANENAGVIAANNKGTITGVTTFGNRVEAGHAGGIAGTNAGTITSSAASDSVITNGGTAGGIAGTNTGTGTIGAMEGTFVTAESAVTSGANGATAIGGVVGKNEGEVNLANSLGVTNGENVDENVGGIAGDNSGTMYSLYNESVVTGNGSVGGVAGTNSGEIENAVNTTGITATGNYAGGLAGVNSGTIDSGRNTGTINGKDYVGGMVGKNEKADGKDGMLENLSNAVTAAIFGGTNVGGIAGTNFGTITSDNNLVNEGTVYGNQNVGGIAGVNEQSGVIENVTSETLVLKTDGNDAKYFGGIAGQNAGTITDATNESNVEADGAIFVGGIAGKNTDTGKLTGSLVNNGDVTGLSNVGGLAGENNNSSLLKGGADNPLRVTNNGTITATNGGAGGIFHTNTGDIEYAVLTNNGTIIAKGENANTGGLFGYNSGNIVNATLANSGEVKGGENTGGLFGKNSGNASFSSLVNTGKVSGGANTGGLIGYNTGTLTGGRGTGENGMTLYKYQIYNNGAVSGTDNVGGLIGHNDKGGALYAGYNTGAVTATGNNAGGIAGQNDGSVSSVFNTIMTGLNEDGTTKYGAVTGKTNVGGIVGSNTGKLTNAYNTTAVESGGTKGNIAGSNSGEVENVYATNNDKNGMLIGTGNGTVTNGYNYDETKKDSASYEGFFEDGNDVWRIYEGYSTPLLRVFLTDAKYKGSTNQFTYNATMQGIKDLQNVTAADGLNGSQISSIAEVLLTALEQKNAGTDYLAFSSTQIAANNSEEGFNPNNLGYDIDATYTIKQAPLKITLKDIYRVYGDETMFADEDRTQEINYSDAFFYEGDGIRLNRDMLKELGDGNVYIEDESVTDKAVEGVSGEKKTNDAGDYLWSVIVKLADGIKKNYTFGAGGDDDSITVKGDGLSHVAKADLEVTLSDVERIYGNASITQGTYAVGSDTLTNGDSGLKITDGVVITDNGLLSSEMTKDANNNTEPYYTWYVENTLNSFDGVKNLSNNYNLTLVNPGKSIVMKRALYIDDILGTIQYGSTGDFNLENGVGFKGIDEENMTGLLEGDSVSITVDDIVAREDGEYELNRTNGGNRATADVKWTNGEIDVYKDSLKALVMLSGDDKKNYYLADANENGQATVNGDIKVTPQELYVTLDKVVRDYGNKDIKEGGYTVTDSFIQSLVNGDAFSKEDIVLSGIFDGALTGEEHGRVTYDVKEDNYKWYATGIDKEKTPERLYSNYKILIGEDVTGESVLDKAVLTLTPNDATTTYGTAFDENSYSYTLSGVTNDDEENALRTAIGVLEYGNDAAFYGEGGKYTADAATHNNAVYIKNLNEKTLTNYNVVGDKGAAIITKATLDVALNPVERTYGDTTLTHGDYSINTDWLDKLVNGDELMYTGDEISISGIISDKAVIDEYTTNDAGGHSWSAKVNTSALAQNYNINEIAIGSSIVNKAKLTVNAGHAETTYGTPFDKNKYYYDLVGVTNGDSESEIKAQIGNVAYDNTAAIEDGGDRVTDNAGVNGVLSILTDLFGIELGNYEIEKVNDGTATVEKADLFITAHDKHTHVGREPEYTGTTLDELELVNGDTLANFSHTFGIEEASMLDEAGHYAGTIAAVVDGQYYYDGTHDWSAHHDVFANYKVNVEAGNLTVVRPMPTIPHYNYGWLYNDAPYGRKWNFRERKAEIYFQDGGMVHEETM